MAREKFNKLYLALALSVSASTITSPFLVGYSIHRGNTKYRLDETLPYALVGFYSGVVFSCGLMEFLDGRKKINECPQGRRIPIDELMNMSETTQEVESERIALVTDE